MGPLSFTESRARTSLPGTPPELVSPTATSFSSRSSPSAEALWASRALISLPMSSYDKPNKANEVPDKHGDLGGNFAPRQQLPSLSSLFGPPPSIPSLLNRPGNNSNNYSSPPSVDRSRRSTVDSNSSSLGFPLIAEPRTTTFEMKYDSDRSVRPFPSPHSPNFPPDNITRPRADTDSSGRWSMNQDFASRQEYSLGSRDLSYRSPRDNYRPQFASQRAPSSDFLRNGHHHQSQQTPIINVASDSSSPKDVLGPKIWTGTHFLPRFIRASEVPGEGMCYFYDDGSHCKTVIDGEAVNAHWGVTKAGKPRKRLAIACVTCREKKIKCDPDFPRCMQCDKFGRECKFKNAPRGGQNTSPSSPPAELDDSTKAPSIDSRRIGSDAGSPLSTTFDCNTDLNYKRLRVGVSGYVSTGECSPALSLSSNHAKSPLLAQRINLVEPQHIPDDVLNRAWLTDPCAADIQSVQAVIIQFFIHTESAMMLRFIPESTWRSWVSSTVERKSREDLMLVYAVLALGVSLSGGAKHSAFEYAQVAFYAQKSLGTNCLQLCQTQIILASYSVSVGRMHEASQLMAAAAATASCMQLNQELERSSEANMTRFPFGLSRVSYSECRRRTLWSLFILERLSGLFPNRPAMVNPDDIYTRLPVDNQSFERQVDRAMPYFHPHEPTSLMRESADNDIPSSLVEIVHIWAECQSAVYKIASRPAPSSQEESRLNSLASKAYNWHNALPACLRFSISNLESACFAGNSGSLLAMNALYYQAMIKVNRHHQMAGQMSSAIQEGHIRQCRDHSWQLIDMVRTFEHLRNNRPGSFSTMPYVIVKAVVEAIDVLTANGSLTRLNDLIKNIQSTGSAIECMVTIWDGARDAKYAIDRRLGQLANIRERGSQQTSPAEGYRIFDGHDGQSNASIFRWQISEPLETALPKEMDVIYAST